MAYSSSSKPYLEDNLLRVLEDLEKYDLNKFKSCLLEDGQREDVCLPRIKVKDAFPNDLSDLMKDYFPDSYLEKAREILYRINMKNQASKLTGTVKDLNMPKPEQKAEYKNLVKNRYDKIRLPSGIPGELEDLEAFYTELLIVRKFWGKERQELRRSSGVGCLQQMSSLHEEDPEKMTIGMLFDPDKKGRTPQTIILHGAAGTGKTYTLRKILLDWASEKIYEDLFDFVFYIDCKELLKKKEEVTLSDLLWHTSGASRPVIQKALMCPDKILFLVDGVDELFGHMMDENSNHVKKQSWPIAVTITKLLNRDHAKVQRAKILLTTRSLCLHRVEEELISADVSAEVLGFLEEGIKDYFTKLVLDKQKAIEIYEYIQDNEMILTMCFIPALSWVVCTAVMSGMDDAGNLKAASTTTQVFLSFVVTLLRNHCPEFQNQHHRISILEKLGILALHGIRNQQFSFDEEDIHQLQQDLPEKIQSIFLNSIYEKKIIPETQYGFTHTIVQEFIAALYYFSSTSKDNEMNQLLKDAFENQDPHKIRIVRFLFGLDGQKASPMLKKLIGTPSLPSLMKELLYWVKKAFSIEIDGYFQRELLHCLYELQNEQQVKEALKEIKTLDLSRATLSRLDCSVLKFCLTCCPCLDRLDLPDAPLGQKELEILLPELHRCQSLKVSAKKLSEEFAKQVCIQLSAKLYLWGISLEGEPEGDGVLLFCQAAHIRRNCNLTVYYLREEFLLDFCQCLNSYICLTDIRIHDTSLGSSFLMKLSSVLNNNKLETLRLAGNGLTSDCIHSLISFLHVNCSLEELYLGRNSLGDGGIIQLLQCLPQMCSGLQQLSIMSNGLTKECMPQLHTTALKCQALEVLDLDDNRLCDEGVENLCLLLANRDCRLKTLVLSQNNLTDACLEPLACALSHNMTLRLLDLSSNHLTLQSLCTLQSMWTNSLRINLDGNDDIPSSEIEKFSRPRPQTKQSRWQLLKRTVTQGLGVRKELVTSEKPGLTRKTSIPKSVPKKFFRSSASSSSKEWSSSLESECMNSEPKVHNREESSSTSSRTEEVIRGRNLTEDLVAAETKIREIECVVEHGLLTDDCGMSNTPEAQENPSVISDNITSRVTSENNKRAVQITHNALTTDNMKEGDLKKMYGKIVEEISCLRHESSQQHQEIMDSLKAMSRSLSTLENLCQKILVQQQELHDNEISPPASSKRIQSSGTPYMSEVFLGETWRPPGPVLKQPTNTVTTQKQRKLQRAKNQDIPDA